MNSKDVILLVGGGTGGHIYPLIAVAEDLKKRNKNFFFVGEKRGREEEIVGEYNWLFYSIIAGKWRRYWSLSAIFLNLFGVLKLIVGIFQSIKVIISARVTVVFSKGGYVALPVVIAAKILGKRIIIHESDTIMGLTNKISVRLADTVLTAFKTDIFPNKTAKFVQVGIPIRQALFQASKLKSPQKNRPLILIMGGIQGSKKINSLVRESLSELIDSADVVHVTGESEYILHKNIADRLDLQKKNAYRPYGILKRELPYYYQLTDLIVCRSGATTLAEASLFKRALYLIPLSSSSGNHQQINAEQLQSAGAAVVANENNLTSEKFAQDIKRILVDKAQRNLLSSRLESYFDQSNTNERIVEIILGNKNG